MASRSSHNKNNAGVKRILQEAKELANDESTDYYAAPLEEDIFEWHCTLRGPPGTEFEGGLYHCRIVLPSEYPFRPPSVMMLTPSGRFELNTKICISFTSYHEELWQPAWGIRTAIVGLLSFFPMKGTAAAGIGALEYPTTERKRLAALSRNWSCPHCQQSNLELLPDPVEKPVASTSPTSAEEFPADPPAPSDATPSSPTSLLSLTVPTPALLPEDASLVPKETSQAPVPEIVVPAAAPVALVTTQANPPAVVQVQQPAVIVHAHPAMHAGPKAPVWLDGMIFFLLSVTVGLFAKKILYMY